MTPHPKPVKERTSPTRCVIKEHRLLQVAYHEQAVVVPFQIAQSALRVPVAVPYTVRSLAGSNVTAFISEQYTEGLLEWDQQPGTQLNFTIPVNWTAISPQAEYRLGLTFGPAWNAAVTGGVNQTALHIFGVLPGQCPPGTYRCTPEDPPSCCSCSQPPRDDLHHDQDIWCTHPVQSATFRRSAIMLLL